MKKNGIKVTLLIAAIAFSFTSFAQEAKKDNIAEKFAKADTNDDKKLDKAEVTAANNPKVLRAFDKIDSNKDGFLTLEEGENYKAAQKAKREAAAQEAKIKSASK